MSEFRRRLMMAAGKKEMPDYLYFSPLVDGVFTLTIGASVRTADLSYIEYSTDGGTSWTRTNNVNSTTVTITTPTILQGEKVLWRGSGTRTCNSNSSSSSYCCIFSSNCNYNAGGLLATLLVPNATKDTTITEAYAFPRLFYDDDHIKDAGSIILPPNIVNFMYRSMFNNSSSIEVAPPMPILTLAQSCYRQMFNGCSSINWVKMLATDISATQCIENWFSNAKNSSSCVFIKHINAAWTTSGNSGVPTNWTIIYYDPALDKYYTDQTRATECDDHGNPI